MRLPLVLLLSIPLVVAGCVTPTPPNDVGAAGADLTTVLANVQALLSDVPCEATSIGAATSENMLDLGVLRFEESPFAEMDVRDGIAVVALYGLGGLAVVDIRDPTNLTILGTFTPEEGGAALDVKWLPDGTGAIVAGRSLVHVVDLTDLTAPVLASTFTYEEAGLPPGQAHMVTAALINDEQWVFIATQTSNQPWYVLKRSGWELEFVTSAATLPVLNSLPLGNHDITFVHDEIADIPMLYIADGLAGWSAWDVSNPASPKMLGATLSPEPGPGYTHTVRVTFDQGKRFVTTMSEVGANTLKIYDATDLRAPVLLAQWRADETNPHAPQHNIQIVGGHLYLAHYTYGVFVFDVSGMASWSPVVGSLNMEPIAHWAVPEQGTPSALGFANVWDVTLHNGIVYVTDMVSGLNAVGFGCLEFGDASQSATA